MSDVTLSVEALAEMITAAYREGLRNAELVTDEPPKGVYRNSDGEWWFKDAGESFGPYQTAELAERGLETRKGAQKHD